MHVDAWGPIRSKVQSYVLTNAQEICVKVIRLACAWFDDWQCLTEADVTKLINPGFPPLSSPPPMPSTISVPSNSSSIFSSQGGIGRTGYEKARAKKEKVKRWLKSRL